MIISDDEDSAIDHYLVTRKLMSVVFAAVHTTSSVSYVVQMGFLIFTDPALPVPVSRS